MAKTGYLVIIYQDINPSSPTYNQTREERLQDETNCPYRGEANWIEDTKYCELTENGMLTGYEITVYRDVEPLSSTYNQTREEKELNLEECEADETTPNWQNIGDPFCRQKVYLPGGLMGNDGYMIQQQQDMNEYSETADEIREIETLDLTNCPLPNTLPDWEVIYEACHIVKQDGQLMFDGTKDVVRIDRNQYSPSWNNNVPETVNIEDLVNCPPDIEVQYRWVGVSGEYMCVGYDKHSVEKKQRSTDGETWVDVMPLQTRAGALIEANSEDCGYEPTIEYRWVVVDEQYICVGFDKHAMEKKQQSVDGGEWTDVSPLETRAGEVLEANSEDCGYQPTFEYRWVVITGQYECVGYDKYSVEKKQQSTDGGQNWTDVEPLQTRTGSLIEQNSTDCGYLEPQYRWVTISDEYMCVGFDKYTLEKKQQSVDGGTTWTDVVPTETRTGSVIEYNSEDCGYVPPTPGGYENQYLTFEAIEDGTFTFYEDVSYTIDNGETWTVLAAETNTPTITTGNKIMWKAEITPKSNYGIGAFSSSGRYNVEGNPMSLLFGDNFKGKTDLTDKNYAFFCLFSSNSNLVNAQNLSLPATTLANNCYNSMFQACTSLVTAPELPATTLATYCYQSMFYGCTSLTTAPELPATTLAIACYDHMFYGCSSLVTAPELSVTTLAQGCYNSMFQRCTALTTAPTLPATELVVECYERMFNGCTSLSYIKAMFTTAPGYDYTSSWVSGVSSTGTFVKNSAATWNVTGVDGIPSGWTIQNQ